MIEECSVQVTANGYVKVEWAAPDGRTRWAQGTIVRDPLRDRTITVLVDLLRRNQLSRASELEVLGEQLYSTLFGGEDELNNPDSPASVLGEALEGMPDLEGDDSDRLLRITLDIDPVNRPLMSWPWEYLYVPGRGAAAGGFLGEGADFLLIRRLSQGDRRQEVLQPPLRVLFVAPDLPSGELARTQYEGVLETLMNLRDQLGPHRIDLRVLTQSHKRDGTEYDFGDEVRTDFNSFLDAAAEYKPNVIHIITHGRYQRMDEEGRPAGQLAFASEFGPSSLDWVPDHVFAEELRGKSIRRNLRLVFLQSCESAAGSDQSHHPVSGMAQMLAQQGVHAVVAMQFEITQRTANEFARAFYGRLMTHPAVEEAMRAGRTRLRRSRVGGAAERRGFGMPVLYLRDYGPLMATGAVTGGTDVRPTATGSARRPVTEAPPEVPIGVRDTRSAQPSAGESPPPRRRWLDAPEQGSGPS